MKCEHVWLGLAEKDSFPLELAGRTVGEEMWFDSHEVTLHSFRTEGWQWDVRGGSPGVTVG